MAADGTGDEFEGSFMERLLDSVESQYREEHGEDPPEEFLRRARSKIVQHVASKDREDHRGIYDALAEE